MNNIILDTNKFFRPGHSKHRTIMQSTKSNSADRENFMNTEQANNEDVAIDRQMPSTSTNTQQLNQADLKSNTQNEDGETYIENNCNNGTLAANGTQTQQYHQQEQQSQSQQPGYSTNSSSTKRRVPLTTISAPKKLKSDNSLLSADSDSDNNEGSKVSVSSILSNKNDVFPKNLYDDDDDDDDHSRNNIDDILGIDNAANAKCSNDASIQMQTRDNIHADDAINSSNESGGADQQSIEQQAQQQKAQHKQQQPHQGEHHQNTTISVNDEQKEIFVKYNKSSQPQIDVKLLQILQNEELVAFCHPRSTNFESYAEYLRKVLDIDDNIWYQLSDLPIVQCLSLLCCKMFQMYGRKKYLTMNYSTLVINSSATLMNFHNKENSVMIEQRFQLFHNNTAYKYLITNLNGASLPMDKMHEFQNILYENRSDIRLANVILHGSVMYQPAKGNLAYPSTLVRINSDYITELRHCIIHHIKVIIKRHILQVLLQKQQEETSKPSSFVASFQQQSSSHINQNRNGNNSAADNGYSSPILQELKISNVILNRLQAISKTKINDAINLIIAECVQADAIEISNNITITPTKIGDDVYYYDFVANNFTKGSFKTKFAKGNNEMENTIGSYAFYKMQVVFSFNSIRVFLSAYLNDLINFDDLDTQTLAKLGVNNNNH